MIQSDLKTVSLYDPKVQHDGLRVGNQGIYNSSIGNLVLVELIGFPNGEIRVLGLHIEDAGHSNNGGGLAARYIVRPVLDEETQNIVAEELRKHRLRGEFVFYDLQN
jgi:hypothetical protein